MTNEQALDQAVMKLIPEIAIGGAGGRPNVAIVDALEEQLPELRRLRGEVWLEAQARTLKPRLPRGTLQRADLGDPAALALIAEREARWAAEGRDAHGRPRAEAAVAVKTGTPAECMAAPAARQRKRHPPPRG